MAQLPDELVREILLRVTPDDPACLLRAAAVCKGWRRILADPDFRCRHRELHPTPHVAGFLRIVSDDVPYSSRFESTFRGPAARDLPGWLALDCRHGRALFAAPAPGGGAPVALDFIVWNPLTDERRLLPRPSPHITAPTTEGLRFNAAVLCAATAQGCDHRGCHSGPFHVVFLFRTSMNIWARVYSSETDDWGNLTIPIQGHNALVDNALKSLMALADGKNCFTTLLEDPLRLCQWSLKKASTGVVQWVQGSAFNLEMLLPKDTVSPRFGVIGSVEGTDTIFVIVYKYAPPRREDVYMVHLNSGKITKVFEGYSYVFPYTSFCIQVIDEAYTGEEPRVGVQNA